MAAAAQKTIKLGVLHRSYKVDRAMVNKEKRTVRVRFSSEAPVKRWFGEEILDHSSSACDLSRMQAGASVLMEHDPMMRCGITESATITPDRTGEAEVRFAKTPMGDSCMGEVEDGTLRWLSVGYRVSRFQVNDDEDEYRAIEWEPLEISFVAIPADPNCQTLRNQQTDEREIPILMKRSIQFEALPTGGGGSAPAVQTPPAAPAAEPRDLTAEVDEAREILVLGSVWEKFCPGIKEEAERAVKDKMNLKRFQVIVLEKLNAKEKASLPSGFGAPAAQHNNPGNRNLSIGERFVQSEVYRKLCKGTLQQKRSIVVEMEDVLSFRGSNPLNAATEGLTSIQKLPGVPGLLDQRQLFIADLIAQGTTDGLTVRYIQEDAFTNAATAVAEGATKPVATLDLSEVDATVRKIAVYAKTTEEMIADFQQVQAFISARLGYMVQQLEDNHLLNGTGSTNQIKGILLFTGLQTLSGASSPADGIFKAISYVRGANGSGNVEPDAVVINSLDWMNLKITKDTGGQYYGGGPFSGQYGIGGYTNIGMVWGLPAVVTTAIAQGTALVGAFRFAAQIFRRMGLTIDTTNCDQDDFIKNLITIRAEERLALAVYKPAAFCKVTGIPSVP